MSVFAFPSALTEGARRATEVSAESRREAPPGHGSRRLPLAAGLARFRLQKLSFSVIPAHDVRAVEHTQRPVAMFAHVHPAARQRPTPAALLDLQNPVVHPDRVVPIHGPLVLYRENAVRVSPLPLREGVLGFGGPDREAPVELPHIALAQETIRRLQALDAGQPQLLRRSSGILCVNRCPLREGMKTPTIFHGLGHVSEAAIS